MLQRIKKFFSSTVRGQDKSIGQVYDSLFDDDIIKIIAIVNSLINIYRHSQLGFYVAAHDNQLAAYKELFEGCSQQRARFVSELEDEIIRLNGHNKLEEEGAAHLHKADKKECQSEQICPLISDQYEQIKQEYEKLLRLQGEVSGRDAYGWLGL